MEDNWTLEDPPKSEDIQFLENRIYEYNVASTGYNDGRLLGLFMRDEGGTIVAGLYGWTWGGCLQIQDLWVHEELRGRGHGMRLLLAAEAEAIARGCQQAQLETHSFQAPEFYPKFGYEVVGVIEGYPRGHKKYFFRKTLGADDKTTR
jgi:ribosomal protein S18 acetylase RimI-like enzyme